MRKASAKCLVFLLLLLTAYGLRLTAVVWACPFCKDALFSPGEGQALSRAARAFNLSIVTLAAVPFLLVGGIAWLIVRSSRRLPATGREAARHEGGTR